uniref:Mucin n=1 Tax=Panagrolaimus sp. ES5 TaxID=591445 RepID=A0AC34GDW2_9BILA
STNSYPAIIPTTVALAIYTSSNSSLTTLRGTRLIQSSEAPFTHSPLTTSHRASISTAMSITSSAYTSATNSHQQKLPPTVAPLTALPADASSTNSHGSRAISLAEAPFTNSTSTTTIPKTAALSTPLSNSNVSPYLSPPTLAVLAIRV